MRTRISRRAAPRVPWTPSTRASLRRGRLSGVNAAGARTVTVIAETVASARTYRHTPVPENAVWKPGETVVGPALPSLRRRVFPTQAAPARCDDQSRDVGGAD